MDARRVVVIGGGYAGTAAAKELDATADVTLVDRKEVFFHRPAALRAAVHPAWTEQAFIPYDQLLMRGRVVVGEVTGIDVDRHVVVLASGAELAWDVVILALGAGYPEPARFAGTTAEDAARAFRAHQEAIAAARHILVVGGGPAGVELAAEIASSPATARVTLAHGGPVLLTGHPEKLGRRAEQQLRALDVDVLLGADVHPVEGPEHWVGDGIDLHPDLVFTATGSTPDTGWLADGHAAWLDPAGRLRVDPHLNVGGHPDVFAAGDVTDVAEPKLAQYAQKQGREAARNALAVLDGGRPGIRHVPTGSPMIMIPMGERDGVGLFPMGLVVGSRITAAVKSRTLLVPHFRKALNQKAPS